MERQYGYLCKSLFGIGTLLLCGMLLVPALRLIPAGVQAQLTAETNRDEFESRIQVFFNALARGNSAPAFEELLRQSPLGSPDAGTQATELRNKVDEMQTQFGEILYWEKFETRRINNNVAVVRYILMYDQYPVVWIFTFYRKPSVTSSMPNPWVLVELHLDTNMKSLL
jgi:hypothetical protein